MTPDDLLELFARTAAVVREALSPITGADRRARTDVPSQYAIDLVADAAALSVLHTAPVRIVSEESNVTGDRDAAITVVIDPIDGSTNCARNIPYWAISLCALDSDGALVANVTNQATGVAVTAVRGAGAWRDGVPIRSSAVARVEDAVVALDGEPASWLPWKQFRALGSAALALCDVACGHLDGYVDPHGEHKPWDYLGGMLACTEADARVVDVGGRPLAISEWGARRHVVAASTPELLDALRQAAA